MIKNEWISLIDIRCLKLATRERFSAVISTPDGLVSAPVFERRPSIDPITSRVCQILPTDRGGTYKLEVSSLDACGVEPCPQDGQVWAIINSFPSKVWLNIIEMAVVAVFDVALPGVERAQVARRRDHRDPLQAAGSHRRWKEGHWFQRRVSPSSSNTNNNPEI